MSCTLTDTTLFPRMRRVVEMTTRRLGSGGVSPSLGPHPVCGRHHLLLMVTPAKSSVRNGVSGSPAPLNMLTIGLLAQP